jgi:hypothetical protein
MNLYLCFIAVIGAIIVTLSLVALIPNGMWFFLFAVIAGTVALTYSTIGLLVMNE